MRRFFPSAATLLGLALLIPSDAVAMNCDDIMNMLGVNVPEATVVQIMADNNQTFSQADITCLRNKGAPAAVISQAQSMSSAPAPAPAPAPGPINAPVPAPVPGPAPATGFEGTTEIGGGGDLGDLPEQGEAPSSGGPPIVEQLIQEFRNKKYLTASKGLYDLEADNTYPGQKTKIQYYLAKSLFELEMYHGAQHYFMQVVRKGPKNPYFKYALPRLIDIAKRTGNDAELLRIVKQIPPEAFPRQAKNHLYYLMGRKFYEADELSGSAQYFRQISAKSNLYMRSKYFEGIIHNERGKLKSAVMAFREVMTAAPPPSSNARDAKETEDLKDLALINVARVYFGLERFENADNYYAMVDRESTYWPESLFERAWTNFWRQDLNLTLGLLLTVESPYFNQSEYIPEITVLRALTFFNLCEYDEVERILHSFEGETKPVVAEMNTFVEQFKSKEDQKLADQAFDAYFKDPHKTSSLDKAMFVRILRNRDLAALVRHMDMMDEEIAAIDAQKGVWKTTIGDALKKQIEKDRQRYKRKAGIALLREIARQKESLEDLLVQSEIIRFEVVDAQRQDYEFKTANPDVGALDDSKIDFATSKEIIYWPFNGEFWADELGYYRYTEKGKCE